MTHFGSRPIVFIMLHLKGGELVDIWTQQPNKYAPPFSAASKLARVTHSISLSCARARVVTYYTEVFGGNAAKASVFDVLHWRLYPRSQGCVWTQDCFFSAHTELQASGPWGDILWIWQNMHWLRIIDYTFQLPQSKFATIQIYPGLQIWSASFSAES